MRLGLTLEDIEVHKVLLGLSDLIRFGIYRAEDTELSMDILKIFIDCGNYANN